MDGKFQIHLHLMKSLAYSTLVFKRHVHIFPQMCSVELSQTFLASDRLPRGYARLLSFQEELNTLALT